MGLTIEEIERELDEALGTEDFSAATEN